MTCDCYPRVDNQTSGHDVISDGVMWPTIYLQSSLFSLDQLLLFALRLGIPILFSPYLGPPTLYFSTFSLLCNRVFHLTSLALNCLPLFSLIHFSHSLQSILSALSSTSPPLHHQSLPVSQSLGQEINDGREALAVSDFLLSKLNCLSRAVFSPWTWYRWQLKLLCYH